ncbi:hypothetical protein BDR26DRAFT_859600 [Obelidium mucronatum]|nr:hypothetical protein BDR26DRAFT_859600 [Obelidium mucronatum]
MNPEPASSPSIPGMNYSMKQQTYSRLTRQHTSSDSIYTIDSVASLALADSPMDCIPNSTIKTEALNSKRHSSSINQLDSLFSQIKDFNDDDTDDLEATRMMAEEEYSEISPASLQSTATSHLLLQVPGLVPGGTKTPTTSLSVCENTSLSRSLAVDLQEETTRNSRMVVDSRVGSRPCRKLTQEEIDELYSKTTNSSSSGFGFVGKKEKMSPVVAVLKRHVEEIMTRDSLVALEGDRKNAKVVMESSGKSLKLSLSNLFRKSSSTDLLNVSGSSPVDMMEISPSLVEKDKSKRRSLFGGGINKASGKHKSNS